MNLRILVGVVAFAVVAISPLKPVHARPLLDRISPEVFAAASSQERTIGTDTRAAGAFTILGSLGGDSLVTGFQAIMIGKGTAGVPQPLGKFGVAVYASSPFTQNMPGVQMFNFVRATSVQDGGSLGGGYRRYLVTFNVGNTPVRLANNRRYWLSVYGQQDDSNTWRFARDGGAAAVVPTCVRTGTAWSSLPLSAGYRAFEVHSTPLGGNPGPLAVRRLAKKR